MGTNVDAEIASIEARFAALGRATEWVESHVPSTITNARGYVDDKSPKYDPDQHLARILRVAEWLLVSERTPHDDVDPFP